MGRLNYLAELLYPPRCAMCGELMDAGKEKNCLCDLCRGIWEQEKTAGCPVCRKDASRCSCTPEYNKSKVADEYRAVVFYESDNVRKLIYAIKTRYDEALFDMAAGEIALLIMKYYKIDAETVLAYPHRSAASVRKYGFDHARLLCRKVSSLTGLPVFDGIMHRRGAQQKTLSLSQRGGNAAKSYYVPDKYRPGLKNKKIIFIDDVVTTGATSAVCAALCKAEGAVRFSVFSIARTP